MDKKGCLLLISPWVSSALYILFSFLRHGRAQFLQTLFSPGKAILSLFCSQCSWGHWILLSCLICLFLTFREGINWEAIDWMDNAECLDLIEKVSNYLGQFPGTTTVTADCLGAFPVVSWF